jgi:AmmeMemoRadiSam system protein A
MKPGNPQNESATLSEEAQRMLLAVARESIAQGIESGHPLRLDPLSYDPELQEVRASFVTLHLCGQLRGCMGALEASRSLVGDVAHTAFSAAFRDPRFSPVVASELEALEISISVLSQPEEMTIQSEADLLQQMRPGIDGLLLREGSHSGTLLPSVWESIPDPIEFLRTLKRKANLPTNYWSETITVYRYTTESFS